MALKGRTPTAEESRYMAAINQIGCIACRNMGIDTPPEYTLIHHTDGKTKPGAHFLTLPLCWGHHDRCSPYGFHRNPTEWQAVHGTEEELMDQCARLAGYDGVPDAYA